MYQTKGDDRQYRRTSIAMTCCCSRGVRFFNMRLGVPVHYGGGRCVARESVYGEVFDGNIMVAGSFRLRQEIWLVARPIGIGVACL